MTNKAYDQMDLLATRRMADFYDPKKKKRLKHFEIFTYSREMGSWYYPVQLYTSKYEGFLAITLSLPKYHFGTNVFMIKPKQALPICERLHDELEECFGPLSQISTKHGILHHGGADGGRTRDLRSDSAMF